MDDERAIMTASRFGWRRSIAIVVSAAICCCTLVSPASSQSVFDRFKSLFDKKSEPVEGAPSAAPEAGQEGGGLTCPDVSIRAGASTYAVGLPGKQAVGNDLRFQATITRTARECNLNGGEVTARIGIQGRVIAGPGGAPTSVEIPLRVAVVHQSAIGEKTITTKVARTTVAMDESGSVPFTVVAEDVVYPAVSRDINDRYVFYIGFDPQALKPEPKPKAPKKK